VKTFLKCLLVLIDQRYNGNLNSNPYKAARVGVALC